jgi:hypothetical protein
MTQQDKTLTQLARVVLQMFDMTLINMVNTKPLPYKTLVKFQVVH